MVSQACCMLPCCLRWCCVLSDAGNIGIVGPALTALDADVAFQGGIAARAKDAVKAAQQTAAAQEARTMLGG